MGRGRRNGAGEGLQMRREEGRMGRRDETRRAEKGGGRSKVPEGKAMTRGWGECEKKQSRNAAKAAAGHGTREKGGGEGRSRHGTLNKLGRELARNKLRLLITGKGEKKGTKKKTIKAGWVWLEKERGGGFGLGVKKSVKSSP